MRDTRQKERETCIIERRKEEKREERERERDERERENRRGFRILKLEKQGELKIKEMEAASQLTKENSTNANAKQQGASSKLPYFDENQRQYGLLPDLIQMFCQGQKLGYK